MSKSTRVQSIAIVSAAEKKAAPTNAAPVAAVVGSAAAVERHRSAAAALPSDQVLSFRADADLAHYNAMRGYEALTAVRGAISASGFFVDWSRLDELDSLGRAVVFAVECVGARPRESHEALELLREARPLRKLLLAHARTLALTGTFPAKEVARIAKAKGSRGTALALGNLAALYRESAPAALGGFISAEQITRADDLCGELNSKLRPAGSVRPSRRTPAQRDMMALRNRLWTLFVQTYGHLQQAGGAVWGLQLAAHVPPLQSRHVTRKQRPLPAAPAPATAPTA